jgi:asparagine synthase (glutamine-hydrolysing)
MSVLFGRCNFDGKPIDPKDLDEVRPVIAPYGPDGEGYICKDSLGILYRSFFTTEESRGEAQPYTLASGSILTWDGRLDNREKLICQLGSGLDPGSPDAAIAASAYEHWQTGAFSRLIGDWALCVWDARSVSLILAKDFVGTRQLYYTVQEKQVTWCTLLDPLLLLAGHSFKLDEEYVAGCLSSFPATHLTPYAGICSVAPSSFVRLAKETKETRKYWDFDRTKRIIYRADHDYEEHFRTVFSNSVRRRCRSDSPILAELSGGMDSSSIVCMADKVACGGATGRPTLDTVSYYDDSEPNWNERPYFTKVEEKRGQAGYHIDLRRGSLGFELQEDLVSGSASREDDSSSHKEFAKYVASRGYRVVLSGIGGDEVTGGIPTPLPELADLLARAQFRALVPRLKLWALNKRRPWAHLLSDTIRRFCPPVFESSAGKFFHWLNTDFVRRNGAALRGYSRRLRLFGPLPSFQENLAGLEILRRQLGCEALPSAPVYEKRYPYLDRDLLEFLFAIPRVQLVGPGRRRSLMRRALVGIVPEDVLERRRKAYVARALTINLAKAASRLGDVNDYMIAVQGIVHPEALSACLQEALLGKGNAVVDLTRTLEIESWLRTLRHSGSLATPTSPSTICESDRQRPNLSRLAGRLAIGNAGPVDRGPLHTSSSNFRILGRPVSG